MVEMFQAPADKKWPNHFVGGWREAPATKFKKKH